MSKLLLGTIVSSVLIGLTSVSQAQISPGATPSKSTAPTPTQPLNIPSATPPKSTISTPTQSPKASESTTADLTLLSKAVGVFWQSDRVETDSTMLFYGGGQGVEFNVSAQVKTVAQIGNKFQTQLVIAPAGSTLKSTYTLVSNGRDVWIYRPDRRQYAKTTFKAFNSSGNNSFWTGISSAFFLSLTAADRQEMLSALGTDRDVIKSTPPSQFKDLIGGLQQVDGQNLYAYSYNVKDAGFKINVLLRPQTATIQEIEFNGKSDDMNIKIVEKITSRKPQVAIDRQTFEFIPPKGVKKVKSLKIELFPDPARSK